VSRPAICPRLGWLPISDSSAAVRDLAGLPADDASIRRADHAMTTGLLAVGPPYLARVSDEWDVELFFSG